ncbi:MAG: hypothetical protein HQK50_07465 [Oligoflexia bacterium]|nr:hypothetical protein [Oligoflexia bacterium]
MEDCFMVRGCLMFLLLMSVLFSCTTRHVYTRDQIWKMASDAVGDTNLKVILPTLEFPSVDCAFYGEGCIYGITMSVYGIVMYAIYYETEEQARLAAIKHDAYYKYNWLFDYIQEEPALQDFVVSVYGAERPRQLMKLPAIDKEIAAKRAAELRERQRARRARESGGVISGGGSEAASVSATPNPGAAAAIVMPAKEATTGGH